MMHDVIVETCDNYRQDRVIDCVEKIFNQMGGLSSFVKPGMKVAIKPNLLTVQKPENASTTHPAVVKAVTALVQKAGGVVTIAESPGGPYNTAMLKRVYSSTGMEEVAAETGALLNFDLHVERIENQDAKYVKWVKLIKPLVEADIVINIAKLKTHGFMVYTGAVKNMFGAVAGMEKADFHLRFNDPDRFADSLIDIFLSVKPAINLIDGIVGMEGDGPLTGVPKHLGIMLGARDAFALDYVASTIIKLAPEKVPVIRRAMERDLLIAEEINTVGVDLESVKPDSFDVPAATRLNHRKGFFRKFFGIFGKTLRPRPEIQIDKCVICGKCVQVCPPQVIKKLPQGHLEIDYKKCIRCLCCHEFCPEKAIKIQNNSFRKLLEYKRL